MTRALRHEWHSLLYDPDVELGIWAKLVGGALIEHANAAGVAWPSLGELAARIGVSSENTVRRGLVELERMGLLAVERRAGRVSRYRLTLPALDPLTAVKGSEGRPPHEPPHEPPHHGEPEPGNQRTKEPVRPSRALARTREANAQSLTRYFVDRSREFGSDPPKRVVGQVARLLGELAGEGYDDETLEAAVRLLLERRLHPSTLPTLILEAQAGPPAPRREHVADQLARNVLAERAERNGPGELR